MAAWLYPISERGNKKFVLDDGTELPVCIDTYRMLVENRRLSEDEVWYLSSNFLRVEAGDEFFIYTGDQDLGIIGYAIVEKVDRDEPAAHLRFDLKKCAALIETPVPAVTVRKWVWPRCAVVSLAKHSSELERLLPWTAKRVLTNARTDQFHTGGGGFGDPESNKKVELAAVRFVTARFRREGWEVHDRQTQKLGYDLLCVKGENVEKVEVKGVKGGEPSFILTAAELRTANDPKFVVYVVLNALSRKPVIKRWSGREMKRDFTFTPMQLQAVLKN
jgi:hypothetical protein